MRKTRILICSLLAVFLLSVTGCGKADIEAITSTAEGFLFSLSKADSEALSDYCNEALISQFGLESLSASYNEESFLTGLGLSKDKLSPETQASVTEYFEYYTDNLVQGYDIVEVTKKDGIGKVTATITTYDDQTLNGLSPAEDFNTSLITLVDEYQNTNKDELSSVYIKAGPEAMLIMLYDAVLPDIMKLMKDYYDAAKSTDITIILTIENMEDTWLVTDVNVAE